MTRRSRIWRLLTRWKCKRFFLLKKIIIFLSAWETIEGSVEGSVAMDTSSPWGQESAESTAASP